MVTYAIIDTETLGGIKNPYCPVYDFGLVILRDGYILHEMNIVIVPNCDMSSAYYGKHKREFYTDLIRNENTILCYSEEEAEEMIREVLEDFEVNYLCAYNSGFDFVQTFLSDFIGEYEFIDILKAFVDTIFKYKKYEKFIDENGYRAPNGVKRATAEIAYRFVSGKHDFVEDHTALSDALIETEILMACLDTHRKFKRNYHQNSRY